MPKPAAYVQMTTAGPGQRHTHMHLQNTHSSNAMTQICFKQSHPTHAATFTGTETLYLSSSLVAAKAWWYHDIVETRGLKPWRGRVMYASWYTCIRAPSTFTHGNILRQSTSRWKFRQPILPRLSISAAYWAVTVRHRHTHTHTAPPPSVSASRRGFTWSASSFTFHTLEKKQNKKKQLDVTQCGTSSLWLLTIIHSYNLLMFICELN